MDESTTGLTNLFRYQPNRSLEQLDTTIQQMEKLRTKLGEEKAKQIEKEPLLFYNNERFQIWGIKGRIRSAMMTALAVPATATILNGGRDGIGFVRRNRLLSLGMTIGYGYGFFKFFQFQTGYRS